MSGLKKAWLFVTGLLVCSIAILLPYRARMLFAKVLNYITNPPSWTASLLFKKHVVWWNRVVLAFVFFLGFPIAALILRLGKGDSLAPSDGSATYWIPRRPPEEVERGIRDPF